MSFNHGLFFRRCRLRVGHGFMDTDIVTHVDFSLHQARDTNGPSRHVFNNDSLVALHPFLPTICEIARVVGRNIRTHHYLGSRETRIHPPVVPCLTVAALTLHVHEPAEVVIGFATTGSRPARYHEY